MALSDSDRSRLVARLRAGFLPVAHNGLPLRLYDPDPAARAAAEEAYAESLGEAARRGLMTAAEAVEMAERDGLWSRRKAEALRAAESSLDDLKVALFEAYFSDEGREAARLGLAQARSLAADLLAQRDSYYGLTGEALAAARKARVLTGLALRDPAGKSVLPPDERLWEADLIDSVIDQASRLRPTEPQLRELARTGPWQSLWAVGRPNPFGVPAVDLGDDRLALCNFSVMYERVRESPDRPPREVVEDDDALDGWFVAQRRKDPTDRDAAERHLVGAHARGHKEVFVLARTPAEAARVEGLNDEVARREKAARRRVIEKKGTARDLDFADVRNDLAERAEAARR